MSDKREDFLIRYKHDFAPFIVKKIAIIGGGVSGVATFVELVKLIVHNKANNNISISIFNPSEIGPGTAYVDEDRYLLNQRMADMGGINVYKDAGNDDFYHWVQENWNGYLEKKYEFDANKSDLTRFDRTDKDEFVPRSLYGQYVKARYQEAKSLAAKVGIAVHEIFSTVDDVKQKSTFTKVDYHENDAQRSDFFDKVVVACGHAYKTSYITFKETGRYFRSNERNSIENLKENDIKGKTIVIQGTSLSAGEIALSLVDRGARVHMISRRGLLAAVQLPCNNKYNRQFLTIEKLEKRSKGGCFRLADVLTLLKQEIEYAEDRAVDWQSEFAPQDIKKQLADRLAFADKKPPEELKWRSALMSLLQNDDIQKIYGRLALEDQELFIKEYRGVLWNYMAPMPVKIARKLLTAMEKGDLRVHGGWQTCEWMSDHKQFEVSYKDRTGSTNILHADYMISADGQTLDPNDISLLRNMMKHGEAMNHPCGGIEVDLDDHHIMTKKGKSPNVYAMGPIINGAILVSSRAETCVKSAVIIAAKIIDELFPSKTLIIVTAQGVGWSPP